VPYTVNSGWRRGEGLKSGGGKGGLDSEDLILLEGSSVYVRRI